MTHHEHHIDPFYPEHASQRIQAHPATIHEATHTGAPFIQNLNRTIEHYRYTQAYLAAMRARPREQIKTPQHDINTNMKVFSYGARLALHITDLTVQDLGLHTLPWDDELASRIEEKGSAPNIREDLEPDLHVPYRAVISEAVHKDTQICRSGKHVGHFLDGYATVIGPARGYIASRLAEEALAIKNFAELIPLDFSVDSPDS